MYKSLTIFLLALLPQLAAKLVAWVTLDSFHPSADDFARACTHKSATPSRAALSGAMMVTSSSILVEAE